MELLELMQALKALTDKQFIELFYDASAGRHLYELEKEYMESRLVLANAERHKLDDGHWSTWKVKLLCSTPDHSWTEDAPVCQFGNHCGHETASWAKWSRCPVCGDEVYST